MLYGMGGCQQENELRKIYAPGMWNDVPGFSAMRCFDHY
jgi:hypothetical protein